MKQRWSCAALALMVLMPSFRSFASEPTQSQAIFDEGNAHYRNGDFAAAERAYRQLLERPVDSGIVYYNLGNACFKQKKLGEAIYYWEQARRKMPRDPDVRENLQLANLLIVDRIEVPEEPLPVRAVSGAARLFTIAQETRILLALFVVANALFAAYLLVAKPRLASWALRGSLTAGFLVMVFAGSIAWKVHQERYDRQGVIVEQKVDVRSGPGEQNITVATVHEGIMVRVRGESQGWLQISLPNGWNGWLPAAAVRIL